MSSIVQSKMKIVNTTSSTWDVIFDNPVSAGNAVLAALFIYDTNGLAEGVRFVGASDNLGANATFSFGSHQTELHVQGLAIWATVVGGATTYSFDIQTTGFTVLTPSRYVICIVEVTGANDATYDQSNTNIPPISSTSQTTTLMASGGKTLLLSFVCAMNGTASSTSFDPVTGMTLLGTETDSGEFNIVSFFGKVFTSSTTQTYSISTTTSSVDWGQVTFILQYTTNDPALPVVSAVFGNYFVSCS